MTRFAEGTSVSVEKTRAEIERLVVRYGANQFVTGFDGSQSMIGFGMRGRTIRFLLSLPDKNSKEFLHTPSKRFMRQPAEREKAWEQACRSRWRALLLVIRAKLEAVECGISTIEDEFMAWTVMPGGQTVGDQLRGQIADQIASGAPARLMLTGGGA